MPKKTRMSLRGVSAQKSKPTSQTPPPNHGAEQQGCVQPKRGTFTEPQHPGDAEHHKTSDRVVPGAANRDQPASANE